MDRIKKLKIKKQDGTFSDYIPIGADAEYIDMADGDNLQEEINTINAQIIKIKDYINGKGKYVTGEGTSITLENTINTPFNNIILKGNTKQQQYSGKNLLNVISNVNDTNNGITFSIEKNGFQLKLNGTSQNNTGIAIGLNKIQLPQTGTYYFVAQIISGSVTNNFELGINFGKDNIIDLSNSTKSGKVSFSATKTEGYLTIFVNANISFNNLIINFQVISTDTLDLDFEPYVGGTASPNPDYPQDIKVVTGDNTITISNSDNTEKQELPISLGSLELCKIGDYQDYIYKNNGKWYKHKETNHILLDGVNVYFVNMGGTTNSGHYRFVLSNVENKFALLGENLDTKAKIFSNKLLSGTRGDTYSITNENVFAPPIKNDLSAYGNIGIVYISAISQMTLDNANAWLKDNNIDLYYILATPTEEEITDTTLISQLNELEKAVSYDDTTNISQTNANLPFIINAEAVKKIS